MSGTVLIRLAVPFLLYAVPFAVGMAGLRVSEMLWWCPFVLYIIWLVALLVGLTVYWLQQTYDESSSDEGKFRLLTSEAGLYDIVCRPLWKGSCKPLLLIALLCMGLCPFSIRMDIFSGVPEEILMLHLLVPFLLVPFLMGNLAFSLQSVFWDCLAVNRSHLAEWLILFKYKVVFVVNALLAVICMLLFWRAAGIMILSIFLFTTGFLPIITFLPHPYDNIRWEFLDRKVKRGTPFVTFVEIVVFVGIYALMKMIEIKAGTDVLLRLMSVIGFVSMIFSPLWLRLIARSCQKQRYYLADGFRGNKEGMR
ncbi:MAG: hypothetical protein J5808_01660 [Paludibacteraceae bacterium]|nr:hypothetical protein [Paludibacteraceae bacterium]